MSREMNVDGKPKTIAEIIADSLKKAGKKLGVG